jgi:hypothetical protein
LGSRKKKILGFEALLEVGFSTSLPRKVLRKFTKYIGEIRLERLLGVLGEGTETVRDMLPRLRNEPRVNSGEKAESVRQTISE